MTSYTLIRTGQPPLVFKGHEIASVNGPWAHGVEQDGYHNLAVYRTDNGKYVLSIQYRTQWPDERRDDHAILSENAEKQTALVVIRGDPADTLRAILRIIKRYHPRELVAREEPGRPKPMRCFGSPVS